MAKKIRRNIYFTKEKFEELSLEAEKIGISLNTLVIMKLEKLKELENRIAKG